MSEFKIEYTKTKGKTLKNKTKRNKRKSLFLNKRNKQTKTDIFNMTVKVNR